VDGLGRDRVTALERSLKRDATGMSYVKAAAASEAREMQFDTEENLA
jgi:hypothetical protein